MAEKDFQTWWKTASEDAMTYLKARGQLTKLQVYEKVARIIGVVTSFFVLTLLVGFVIIFVLLMIGSWLTELTGSLAIGFTSVALLVAGLFIALVLKRKQWLEKPVSNMVIGALFDEEDALNEEKILNNHGEQQES